jgi:hypothetical protein
MATVRLLTSSYFPRPIKLFLLCGLSTFPYWNVSATALAFPSREKPSQRISSDVLATVEFAFLTTTTSWTQNSEVFKDGGAFPHAQM